MPPRSTPQPEDPPRRQEPPNAVQIEPVEGCSLSCSFCGVQGIRDRKGDYRFMAVETAVALRNRLGHAMRHDGWNPRLEFAMHGEPTVHPEFVRLARLFGSLNPRELIVVSNGTGFVKDPNAFVAALVDAGITSVCMDQYEGCDFVPRFLARYTGPVPVYDYTGPNAEKFRSNQDLKPPFIVVKEDVLHLTKPWDKVNTHCGGGGPVPDPNPALHKRCAKPFRELSVRWDGNVALCCNDFRGVYKVANVRDHATLEELWQHPAFEAARRMLVHADRGFAPCQWCDALSPRVGLLPDKYGKEALPPPDGKTLQVLQAASAGRPYTTPVLRGWEARGDACLPPLVELGVLRHQPLDKVG
jgi:MoaA/NifB/PqqE/SkfB family radical SAM enzyme